MKGMRARLARERAEARASAASGTDTPARATPPPVWPMRLAAAGIVGLALAGFALLAGWPGAPPSGSEAETQKSVAALDPAPADPTDPAPLILTPDPADPRLVPPLMSAEEIVTRPGDGLAFARLEALPRVLVLDFPSLAAQGAALNRVAALIEKAGFSRARVVSQTRLAERVSRHGGSLETFYYGHNYDTGELARFFRLAVRSAQGLSAAEAALEDVLLATGALAVGPEGHVSGDGISYVISLARMEGRAAHDLRRAILRHEAGHAVYDRTPAYRAHVAAFWEEEMTPEEREAFRVFLAGTGYDVTDEALVRDEMQAYLHYTPDPGMMSDAALGLPEGGLADLRARFEAGLAGLDLPRP